MKNTFLAGLMMLSLAVAILPVQASAQTMYHRYYTYNTAYPTYNTSYPAYDNSAQINALLAQIQVLQTELNRIQQTSTNNQSYCTGAYCNTTYNNGYYGNTDVARAIDVVFKNSAAYITLTYTNGRSEDFIAGGARTTDDVVDFLVRSTTLSDSSIRSLITSRTDSSTHYSHNGYSNSDIREIVVTIDQNNSSAVARVRYSDGTSQRYNYDSSSQSTIERNLASDLDISKSTVSDLVNYNYTNSYGNNTSSQTLSSIDVFWNANDDANVNVYFHNGSTANYRYYNSPSQSDVVTRLADALGMSESQIRNVISFH